MEFITGVLLKDISYLWMIIFIMISAGLAKEYQLFAPAFAYVRNTFRSNKFVLVLLSAIGGILPIEGRVTVSAGLLDTIAPKEGPARERMGIIDYLATHHYYMWSPLEKTVVIPIAAFGLTYVAWLGMIAPLLIVSLVFIGWYIWYQTKEEDLAITPGNFKLSQVIRSSLPMFIAIGAYIWSDNYIACFGLLTLYYVIITQQWNIQKLLGYVKLEVILTVAMVIILGNYFKSEQAYFQEIIKGIGLDPSTFIGMLAISAVGFGASFLMGSSSRFIALAVLMAQLFGPVYFLWFFAVDYAGYLLSPTHKCVMIGNRYFGTPYRTYYIALGTWVTLLMLVAGTFTFLI
jgi:hypothetical protein